MSALTSTAAPARADMQLPVVGVAMTGLAAIAAAGANAGGLNQALLALIGFVAGVSLYHSSFGFTGAWRKLALQRRSAGVRAQLVMIALAVVIFFPALEQESLFGVSVTGFVFPVGVALCLGAFLFGIGMQLGGGCGSGTLYTAGGGSARMVVTLAAFIAGSVIATSDYWTWRDWPDLGAWSLVAKVGWLRAVGFTLAGLVLLYTLVLEIERARHGKAQPLLRDASRGDLLRGPWPLLTGAVMLALVNIATLAIAGRPWGITSAFALWGAKILQAVGVNVATWDWWSEDSALTHSVFSDATSIMDFGIMLGALAAAGLSGAFAPRLSLPARSLAAAVLGGLLMGFGARLATGCNIGAFFSGIASGSAHGLVWLVCAFGGSMIGMRLRPLFGMDV